MAYPIKLCLYITGGSPNSVRAIRNLRVFCEEHLADHYEIEIIDVAQTPHRALEDNVLVTPLLRRHESEPKVEVIGDLSERDKLFALFDPCGELASQGIMQKRTSQHRDLQRKH